MNKLLIIEATRGAISDMVVSCFLNSGIQMVSDTTSAPFKRVPIEKLKREFDRALGYYKIETTIIDLDDGMEEELIFQSDDWDD